jgi:hypothetical protein
MNSRKELYVEELKKFIELVFADPQDDTWRTASSMVKESVEYTFSRILTCNIRNIAELRHAIYVDIQNMVVSFFKDKDLDEYLVRSIRKITMTIFDGDVLVINKLTDEGDCDFDGDVVPIDPEVAQKISRRYGNKGVSFKDVTDEHVSKEYRLELKNPIMTSTEVLQSQENSSNALKTFACKFAGVYICAYAVTLATDKESARENFIRDIIEEYPYMKEKVMEIKIDDIMEVNGTYLLSDGDY